MNKSNILKIENVDLKNIVYDNVSMTDKGNFVISNIWYNNKNNLHSLNVQTPYLKVYRFLDGSVILFPDKKTEDFLENIDKQTRFFIKNAGLFKKYNLQNFRYKALINEMDGIDKNVMRIRIHNEKKPTIFFSSKNKVPMEYNDAKNIFFKVDNLKIILEIDKMVIDLKNNIVSTNVIARLVLLHEIVPKKVELTEYSFIDSDSEENNDIIDNKKKIDETDIILNTQTEYYDDDESHKTHETHETHEICEIKKCESEKKINENKREEKEDTKYNNYSENDSEEEKDSEEDNEEESENENEEEDENKEDDNDLDNDDDSSEEYDYNDIYNDLGNNKKESKNVK
jgi:hypothetical protein